MKSLDAFGSLKVGSLNAMNLFLVVHQEHVTVCTRMGMSQISRVLRNFKTFHLHQRHIVGTITSHMRIGQFALFVQHSKSVWRNVRCHVH